MQHEHFRVHVEVRGQLVRVVFSLLPCGFQGLDPGHQDCPQVPSPVDSYRQAWVSFYWYTKMFKKKKLLEIYIVLLS